MDIYERLEYSLPILSVEPAEINIHTSGKYEGSFYVENVGGSELIGVVFSKDECLSLPVAEFSGKRSAVRFSADLSGLKRGQSKTARVIVSSNGGEVTIPVTMKAETPFVDAPGNVRITSFTEFYNYAKEHEDKAIKLLCSHKYRNWLVSTGYKYINVFDTIIKDTNKERAMKNFFVLNKLEDASQPSAFAQNNEESAVSETDEPPFSVSISKTEFASNEKGFLLITNNSLDELKAVVSTDLEYVKFDKQGIKVKKQSKLYFTAKLSAIQTAQLGIKKLPFYKTKISLRLLSGGNVYNQEFDITIGDVSLKGYEKEIAQGLKELLNYRINGGANYLKKAELCAEGLSGDGDASVPALLFSSLIFIEAGAIDKAKSIIDSVSRHKGYYRENNPEIYGIIMFLSALCDFKSGKYSSYSRKVKDIEQCAIEESHFIFPLALGVFEFEKGDRRKAGEYFEASYLKGCRSSYFAGYLYKLFQRETGNVDLSVFNWFINWAITKDIDIRTIVIRNKKNLFDISLFESGALQVLYNKYAFDFLLEMVCAFHISNDDFNEEAHHYYKEAGRKHMKINRLYPTILRTAKKLKDEDISSYVITEFLNGGIDIEDDDLTAFAYHLIITGSQKRNVLAVYEKQMMEFGSKSIAKGKKGRFYNSLYRLMLFSPNSGDLTRSCADALENTLFNSLFSRPIFFDNKNITHMLITESERTDTTLYAVTGGQTRIKATSDDFEYVCYDIINEAVANEKPSLMLSMVENEDAELYLHFYKKGYSSEELLIALSKLILSDSLVCEDAGEILNKTAKMQTISNDYRTKLNATAANIMCEQGDYEDALSCYLLSDVQNIDNSHLERITLALLENKAYYRLCTLISKYADHVPEQTLLNVITQISEEPKFAPLVADAAYSLLLNKRYSPAVFDTVVKHYKGSIKEFEDLFETLHNTNIPLFELAEIVVENSIYCNNATQTAQKAFVELYGISPENKFVELFTYCCIYEIIVNGTKLRFDVIYILEEIYQAAKDKLLAYALCTFYLENEIRPFKSEDIIKDAVCYMEEDGLILPAMKTIALKDAMTPYIQKKQVFSYRSVPGASVFLHYKLEGCGEFSVKPMKYLRFGIYLASVTMFYGEKITYYMSEEMSSGNIVTEETVFINDVLYEAADTGNFTNINNCLLHIEKSRFDKAESIIADYLKPPKIVVGKML